MATKQKTTGVLMSKKEREDLLKMAPMGKLGKGAKVKKTPAKKKK